LLKQKTSKTVITKTFILNRKQLDEMQKAFNVTTTALIKTIQVADERDIKQNERIMVVEKRLDKMQQTVDSLSSFLNELEFQVFI
jgi:Na+/phosphate symporter